MSGIDDAFPGQRVDATIAQRGGHDGQIARRHVERRLAGVDVGRLLGVEVEALVVVEHARDAPVARVGDRGRLVDLFVERQLAAGETG